MIFIWILLIIINLILWYTRTKSNIVMFITLTMICILMSGNNEGPDISNYIYTYEHQDEFTFNDLGYQYLEGIFTDLLHFDFFQFRYTVTIICFLFLLITFKKVGVNGHLPIALYMIYLFFIDTIQYRNFIAMMMMTYSLVFYVSDRKRDWFIFAGINILVSTVQIISLSSLLFLIPKFLDKEKTLKLFKRLGIIILALSVVGKMIGGNITLLFIRLFVVGESRADDYLATETRFSGFAFAFLALFAYWLILKVRSELMVRDFNKIKYIDAILAISTVSMIFIGTLFLNVSFYRFFRNILILQFIGITLYLDSSLISNHKRNLYFMRVIALAVLWYIIDMVLIEGVEECVIPIFEHNILWSK